MKMTPAQHKESAAINTALMALKDCFHAFHVQLEKVHIKTSSNEFISQILTLQPMKKAAPANSAPIQFNSAAAKMDAVAAKGIKGKKTGSVRVPFRASKLTQVLRESFTDPSHRTLVITAVAPTSTDLLHTLNSLDHVVLMAPPLARTMSSSKIEVSN